MYFEQCKNLWIAVLFRIIKDILKTGRSITDKVKQDAMRFVYDPMYDQDFRGLCRVCNIAPGSVRSKLLIEESRQFIRKNLRCLGG